VIDTELKEGFEEKLEELYKTTCKPYGSMMFGHFRAMLSMLRLFDQKFNSRESHVLFQKIIALALHPSAGTYANGVTFGKAINYAVFRKIGLPVIAERKGMELSALKTTIEEHIDSIDMAQFFHSTDSFGNSSIDDADGDVGITVT
jgi:hypothetical protein